MRQIKISITFFILLMVLKNEVIGQGNSHNPKKVLRIYEDNDFLNLRGKGTDEAYTNGLKIEYFKENSSGSSFFLNKWLPKAGNNAVNTFGWGIMQMIYTPRNISKTEPDKNDFAYAGALFLVRSLQSDNAREKVSFHSEVLLGILGPYSYAKQTQVAFHKLINDQRPMGWDHQLKTDLILNMNFTAEKEIYGNGDRVNIASGGKVMVGTMLTGVSGYSAIRVGRINQLYSGYITHITGGNQAEKNAKNRWQAYIMFKPQITYMQRNALISGGYFDSERKKIRKEANNEAEPIIAIAKNIKYGFDYGFMLSLNNVSLGITQKVESAEIRGARHHEVGNISLSIAL